MPILGAIPEAEIKSSAATTKVVYLDELFGWFLFEEASRRALSAIHPSQFLFSTTAPGLSPRIGLLKQNFVMLENYLREDPDIEHYEEVQ